MSDATDPDTPATGYPVGQARSGNDGYATGEEDGGPFGGDYLYEGSHEVLENLIILTETCIDFEVLVFDLRQADGNPLWSERTSAALARGELW